MPAPPPVKPISGLGSFLKGNAKFAYGGGIGLAFLAADAKNILDADNKLKALLKTAKDFILIRVAMIGIFKGVSDVIKGLVKDTGSLDQALKRLTQVQQYARQFQSFTGSLASAQKRVSELHQLSTRGVFKFEDLVEANKSLEVFTRGAYTSVEATKQVGEAAIASGNSIQDTARAVGNFYEELRAGKPVGEAVEQLRQMGLISGSTADDLTNMSESGASLTTTFSALTDAMSRTAQGASGYKDEIQGVTEAHEKAVAELKTAFGAPFTEQEVQNTQNMTAGLKSITPAVATLATQFAFLYNSAGTAVSSLFKFAAGSKVVQKAIVVLGQAIMAVSVVAGLFGLSVMLPLIGLLYKFSEAAAAVGFSLVYNLTNSFTIAGRAAMALQVTLAAFTIGSVIIMAVAFVTAMVGAFVQAREEAKRMDQVFQDWSKSIKDSTAAILEQAAAVTTLASKYETLRKTMDQLSANNKELKKLRKEQVEIDKQVAYEREVSPGRPLTKETQKKKDVNEAKQAELERQNAILKQSREEQTARQPLHEQLIKQEAERRYFFEQQSKSAEQRNMESREGAKIAADVENKKSAVVAQRMQKEKEMADRQAVYESHKGFTSVEDVIGHMEKQKAAQEEINQLKQQEQAIGEKAPAFSATAKEEKAERLRQAKSAIELEAGMRVKEYKDMDDKLADQRKLEQAKTLAGPEALKQYREHPEALTEANIQAQIAKKREAEPPSPEEEERVKLQKFQIDNDVRGQYARARGDVLQARASQDLSRFTSHFDQLLSSGFGKPEAIKTALEQTTGDIAEEISQARPPVSAMTAIGGGGNLPQVDASLDIARRQEILQQKMVDYLAILSGQEQPEQKTQPVYQ